MADKYFNKTDLSYFWNRLKSYFVDKTTFDALDDKVDEIIAEGGEPNVIESVKVNGSALTPDANKAVNIPVPTATSELTNDGDGTSNFATEDYVDENGGKIDIIKKNGTAQSIDPTDKSVNISVPTTVAELSDASDYAQASDIPTNVSDLTNDSNYQTDTDVQTAIESAISSVYKYKGSVANQAALPESGNEDGDVYDTQDTGMNYAWNGSSWDALGTYVDTSLLWAKSELTAITTAEIDEIMDGTNAGS